ncbi:BAG family molecular chaperone regulator 6 [Lotus japonicus]|uniref:BAG family molecular chaperone regulator 6 n=1 Tax=Lotus japonicus TaxID=34305 RepID=UPI002589E1CA|nr:BAG family molecular chaperone regulator 6 [Lotus japonicus]
MMPAYRSMDSYPHHRTQMPFPHCYHAGPETFPPQLRGDQSKSPFSYEQFWPCAGNYGHPMPSPPPFCCGHNNFPGYYSYYRPSHHHAPVPPPMYYGGCPSAYGEPFFVPYTPQPHYTMEQPRYEYDKCVPREHHCCGCPNHQSNQKEGKSVKIEEQEPDVEKKVNDGLVPFWNGWLPFDMKGAPSMVHDGDGRRSLSRETDSNGRECEDGRMNKKHQSEPKRSEFPFPIFWLPYYNKQEEGRRTNNQDSDSTPKCAEEEPQRLKSVPVKSHVNEGVTNRIRSNEAESTNTGDSDAIKKVTNERIIPVKQVESHQGKIDSEGSNKMEVNIPVNSKEENVVSKDSPTSGKRRSTSPPKASKLPPVCLRVDPLPRKKNGNGSSRSPSPPASKSREHSPATSGETSKTPSCGLQHKVQPNSNVEKVEPKERTFQVSGIETRENKGAECGDGCQGQINLNMESEVPTKTRESYTDGEKSVTEDKKEEKGAESMMEEATESNEFKGLSTSIDEGQKEVRVLSDADAAVLIQAGYLVRKWEPLKKLKQIAEVSKEVAGVRGRVQALEDSSDVQNDKQKIAIGETIMGLLLKLDTIQGLHPSLREIRKSLATELVTLQERLDSIMAKKPQQQMQGPVIQEHVEVAPLNMQNGAYQQEQQEEKDAVPGGSFEATSEGNHDTLEICQDHFCMKDGTDNVPSTNGESELQSPVDPASNEGVEPDALPNGLVNKDIGSVVTVDAVSSTNDPSDTEKVAVEHESEVNDIPVDVDADELDTYSLKELPVGVIDEDIIDISSRKDEKGTEEAQSAECTTTMLGGSFSAMVDDPACDVLGSENQAMMELPVGLLDEDTVTSEFAKDDDTSTFKGELQAENEEYIEKLPVGVLDEDKAKFEKGTEEAQSAECTTMVMDGSFSVMVDATCDGLDSENQAMMELPLGLLDENKVTSEFEKDDTSTLKGEVQAENEEYVKELPAGVLDEECDAGERTRSNFNDILPEPVELMPVDELQKEKEPEEKLAPQEIQAHDAYVDMVAEMTTGVDDKETETLAKEETAAPPALQGAPVAEHGGELYGDMKLLEENEKLRKLMKELLKAGNEQLTVITDLTGRVKDLEKKLAKHRRKRVRTRRGRPTASMKSSNSE